MANQGTEQMHTWREHTSPTHAGVRRLSANEVLARRSA